MGWAYICLYCPYQLDVLVFGLGLWLVRRREGDLVVLLDIKSTIRKRSAVFTLSCGMRRINGCTSCCR